MTGRFIGHLLGSSILFAFAAAVLPAQTADEEALKRLSAEWMNAIERKDRTALDSLLASDFVLQQAGDPEERRTRRAEWVENAIKMDWSKFRYENLEARVHGDHATVSSILHFRISPFPFTFDSGVVDTWERREGRWQVTTRYLGASKLYERVAFLLGALATGIAVVTTRLVSRLLRRSSTRPA